jgi:hypothetical protein
VVLCGRRDAALVASFTAAVEPMVHGIAVEEMLLGVMPLFSVEGYPFNAASILPGLLRDLGDIPDVVASIAPRKALVAAGVGEDAPYQAAASITISEKRFTADPRVLTEWLPS